MKLQQTIPLSSIYNREEDFSVDLAENLDALRIGSFEDVETEAKVGTRKRVNDHGWLVWDNFLDVLALEKAQ